MVSKKKISESEFRTKAKTEAIILYERDFRITDEECAKYKDLEKNRCRQRARVLADKLKKFAKDTGKDLDTVPSHTNLRNAKKIDLSMRDVEFCKEYIIDNYSLEDAWRLTSAEYPLPYAESEMQTLKTGRWYLLKRSHTQAGFFSFACVDISYDKHESGVGNVLKYRFSKKTHKATNIVGGYISRNHNQYMFIGLEAYLPNEGQTTYEGSQLISVKMMPGEEKLSGITLNATNQNNNPCAAKVLLYFTPNASDKHTGLFTEKEVVEVARNIGIDDDQFTLPDDTISKNWGILVATAEG